MVQFSDVPQESILGYPLISNSEACRSLFSYIHHFNFNQKPSNGTKSASVD